MRSEKGMTLIEVLIVLAIIGLVSGLVIVSQRSLKQTALKRSVNQLAGLVRLAHNKALTTGQYYRLHIDLDKQICQVEHAPRLTFVPSSTDAPLTATEEDALKALAEEEGEDTAADFAAEDPRLLAPLELPKGARIRELRTPGREPATQGQAYIYLFPDGSLEPAWVCFARNEEDAFSLEIQPLGGKSRVNAPCNQPPAWADKANQSR